MSVQVDKIVIGQLVTYVGQVGGKGCLGSLSVCLSLPPSPLDFHVFQGNVCSRVAFYISNLTLVVKDDEF